MSTVAESGDRDSALPPQLRWVDPRGAIEGNGPTRPHHVLEDTNGDGVADKATVLRGPASPMSLRRRVYVAEAPYLYVFEVIRDLV